MAEFRIETDRLILRDWREEDWAPFFASTNTPAVMRWLGGLLDDEKKADVRRRLESYREQYGHTFWVIERKDDGGDLSGEILGFCGLKRCNQVGAPIGDFEIGWRLREDAWGKGYAGESARAAMRAGFEVFDAPHMVALTVQGNAASWGLMEKLGMRRRTDLDFASDEWAEEGKILAWSITRDEWLATQ
jgi:RimJ/RimL family protein N-acetyltransferase